MTDATTAQIRWAHSYDGYRRLAASPEALTRLLDAARQELRDHGRVREWCGVDLLRGWAFLLVREDRHRGGDSLGSEWSAVLDRLREHPDAQGPDRPPAGLADPQVPLPTAFSTAPKQHKDSAFLAAKQARWWEPHVAPVNQLVDEIREEIAEEWRQAHGDLAPPVFAPYADPDSGGIAASVLFLLESPAGPAAMGSRMLSADNDDGTAKNIWLGYHASGLPRTAGLHWNAVPWYVGDGQKNKAVTSAQVERGREYLDRLLEIAPGIRVVLALGKPAQASIAPIGRYLAQRGITILAAPHPSPIPAAATRGASLLAVNAAMVEARRIARADGPWGAPE